MKMILPLLLGSLVFSSGYAQEFRFGVGPFSLQFNTDDYNASRNRPLLNDPVCYSITQQKQLEMIVEKQEKVNAKEMKVVTKKLIVEPYAFGVNKEGKPVLRGNVVEDKQLKEVTIKFAEDKFEDGSDKKYRGYFSGWFSSDKDKNIDLRSVSDLRVLENTHFDAPKNYQGIKDDDFQVVCQLPFSK